MVGERKSIREDVPHQPKNNLVPPMKLKDFPKFSISIRNFIVVSEMTLNLFLSRAKPTVYNSGSGLKWTSELMAYPLRSHTCKDFDVKILTEVISSSVSHDNVVRKILRTGILGLQKSLKKISFNSSFKKIYIHLIFSAANVNCQFSYHFFLPSPLLFSTSFQSVLPLP